MGCGASTSANNAAGTDGPPVRTAASADGPLGDGPIAKKLSEMLDAPEDALKEALPGLNRCFARRLPGRGRIYKPLDLCALTAIVETADGTKVGGATLICSPLEVIRIQPSMQDVAP